MATGPLRAAALLAASGLAAAAPGAAPALSPEALASLLEGTPRQVAFTETRRSALLREPLVLSGYLAFEPPDRLLRAVQRPSAQTMELSGGYAIVGGPAGERHRIALSQRPALAAYAATLRGLLSGDLAALSEIFRVDIEGTAADWRLLLTPRSPSGLAPLRDVEVRGGTQGVETIVLTETDGDGSRIELAPWP